MKVYIAIGAWGTPKSVHLTIRGAKQSFFKRGYAKNEINFGKGDYPNVVMVYRNTEQVGTIMELEVKP